MRHHPYKLYGVALIAAVVGLVTLTILIFNQSFTTFANVRVHLERAGLQLLPGSDVKMRGIIVGSVHDITSDGDGADLELRLDPAQAERIPSNVTVRLIPKTLFGEKYVDLVLPRQPSAEHLADGAVIAQDQTKATLEIDQALNDLLPLLRTVPPVELNHTLTALATALSGRGEQLGRTIEELDRFLPAFNPHLDQLGHDLAALGSVTRTYATAADPLLRMLRNLTVTSETIVDEREQLSAFLRDVTGASNGTRELLAQNADDIVAVNHVNRRVVALLARYSPEYPCFVRGYKRLIPRIHDAVPDQKGLDHAAHVVVEFVPAFPTYQYPIDLPEFNDKRGPRCYGLPDPPKRLPIFRYKDGTEDDPRFDAQGGGSPRSAGSRRSSLSGSSPLPVSRSAYSVTDPAADGGLDAILGAVLGIRSLAVPDVADLLWGPIARGSAVNLS